MSQPPTSHPAHPARTRQFRPGILRFSVAQLLGALVLMLVSYPFLEEFKYGQLLEGFFMTLTFTMAIMAVGHRRRPFIIAIFLMAPTLVARWLNHFFPNAVPKSIFLAATVFCLGFMVYQLLRYILREPKVNSEVLCGAVATYLMLGWLWAFGYMLVDRLVPGSFTYAANMTGGHSMTGFMPIYYSFCTLCTVGYGDVVPATNLVRMLAVMESITGVFFGTILIARLVALYSSRPSSTVEN